MNRFEARKMNLQKIIESEYKGNVHHFALNILKLKSSSEIYNFLNDDRKISDKKAQAYELLLGLKLGTLDKDPAESKRSEFIEIPQIKINKIEKNRTIKLEETKVQLIPMLKSWFEKNNINPANVAFIEINSDCMEDCLKNGDQVLIDKSQTELCSREIYAFWYGDDLLIKRLFKDGNEIIAKPENSRHHTLLITPEKALINNFTIIGKVVFRMG